MPLPGRAASASKAFVAQGGTGYSAFYTVPSQAYSRLRPRRIAEKAAQRCIVIQWITTSESDTKSGPPVSRSLRVHAHRFSQDVRDVDVNPDVAASDTRFPVRFPVDRAQRGVRERTPRPPPGRRPLRPYKERTVKIFEQPGGRLPCSPASQRRPAQTFFAFFLRPASCARGDPDTGTESVWRRGRSGKGFMKSKGIRGPHAQLGGAPGRGVYVYT